MRKLTAAKAWSCVFALWAVFLSGVAAPFVGSPGIIQAVRLKSLLASRLTEVSRMEDEVHRLQTEAQLLDKSKVVQQREIRRVLGYAAPDEIIFDFAAGDPML